MLERQPVEPIKISSKAEKIDTLIKISGLVLGCVFNVYANLIEFPTAYKIPLYMGSLIGYSVYKEFFQYRLRNQLLKISFGILANFVTSFTVGMAITDAIFLTSKWIEYFSNFKILPQPTPTPIPHSIDI